MDGPEVSRDAPAATGMGSSATIAVASPRDSDLLEMCLTSILPQARIRDAQIVVARPGDPTTWNALPDRYPGVRFVTAPADADVPLLRGIALAGAAGGTAVLIEDHCVATAGWLDALLARLRAGAEVVGGSMGNARTKRAIDWGAYFSEYGFFGPGAGGSGTPSPTGANVAYAPSVLDEVVLGFQEGLWENVVHDRLRARGVSFAFEPKALILQNRGYGFASFCRDRFDHGLAYARRRLAEEGVNRWSRAAATPFLPFVLVRRVASSAGRTRPAAFLRALPFTLGFLGAWSIGELVGYLRGAVVDEA